MFCKKIETQYVIEKDSGKFDISLYTQLNYIKKPTGGYDTALYLQADTYQYFTEQPTNTSAMHVEPSSAYCNSIDLLKGQINVQNTLGFLYPCHWQVTAPVMGTREYTDISPIPTFTNSNWWSIDSIDATQYTVIDFSSFKDYSTISFEVWPYGYYYITPQTINFPQDYLIINPSVPSQQLPFSGKAKIHITVSRYERKTVNGVTVAITKVLDFLIPTKIYKQ